MDGLSIGHMGRIFCLLSLAIVVTILTLERGREESQFFFMHIAHCRMSYTLDALVEYVDVLTVPDALARV
jgi:hypothetical protein